MIPYKVFFKQLVDKSQNRSEKKKKWKGGEVLRSFERKYEKKKKQLPKKNVRR